MRGARRNGRPLERVAVADKATQGFGTKVLVETLRARKPFGGVAHVAHLG